MAALTVQMEAYAFRQLVEHLQWRTDVQNIDLMNLSGFCRNCLSKWYHAGAKVYGVPMDYDDATLRVYGEPYVDWKKKHNKKATAEQMAKYEEVMKHGHARTDPPPALVAGPTAVQVDAAAKVAPAQAAAQATAGGHSNVCGRDCDDAPVPMALETDGDGPVAVNVAVLTCSDRASQGVYEDKSGPAIFDALNAFAERSQALRVASAQRKVVPDDGPGIAGALAEWSASRACDVIFTTGGTGLGPRDVTPEATRQVIARPADGLARAMAWQTSFQEPHSVLSRGICGVTAEGVLVVNLPGNPAAVRQCLTVVLPLLPQALRMLRS